MERKKTVLDAVEMSRRLRETTGRRLFSMSPDRRLEYLRRRLEQLRARQEQLRAVSSSR